MITTYPPGTTLFFYTTTDSLGNEVYTGDYMIIPPPTAVDPTPAPIPTKPSYASVPVATKTTVQSTLPSGARQLFAAVREGMRFADGELRLYSTGPVTPAMAEGWINSAAAIGADGVVASTANASGDYCTPLALSGFRFNIPDGAVITGLKVTIKRSKI